MAGNRRAARRDGATHPRFGWSRSRSILIGLVLVSLRLLPGSPFESDRRRAMG